MSVRPFWFSFDLFVMCSQVFLPNGTEASAFAPVNTAEPATAALKARCRLIICVSSGSAPRRQDSALARQPRQGAPQE
jgi:hypothetical protein